MGNFKLTMGNQGMGAGRGGRGPPKTEEERQRERERRQEEQKRRQEAGPQRIGRKKKKKGVEQSTKLPAITPMSKCRLRLLRQERVKDYLLMEQEFIQNHELLKPQDEKEEKERLKVDELRGTPLTVGNLEEIIDDDHGIVAPHQGLDFYAPILSIVDKDQLEPGCSVLLNHRSHACVGILADEVDPMVSVMKVDKAPLESYADIGGLEEQVREIKEAVELPLTNPEMYEDIGIRAPKGVILYGEPGTGKTLLAKAVANQTGATFLRVVGSELIKKYLGEGPKLVREIFKIAEDMAPSIVFMDELMPLEARDTTQVHPEKRRSREPCLSF